jgi:prevent-host-death family protein
MRQVNLHEAKTHLSRLVAEAVAGEGFVICKAGKPLVRVTRLEGDHDLVPPRRRLGLLAGQCSVPDDFDQLAAGDIAALFEGRSGATEGEADR